MQHRATTSSSHVAPDEEGQDEEEMISDMNHDPKDHCPGHHAAFTSLI